MAPSLNLDFAFEVEDALSLELDTVVDETADDFAAAGRGLEGGELRFAEAVGPIGREHAMGGAGDRIFGDSFDGREVAAEEVVLRVVAGSGDDVAGLADADEGGHVGSDGAQLPGVGKDGHVVEVVFEDFDRDGTQSFGELGRGRDGLRGAAGKIHDVACAVSRDGERTAGGVEDDVGAGGLDALHNDSSAGEGGVAAEGDFGGGGKPAEAVVAVLRDEEGGFGEIVFGGDGLEGRVGEKVLKGHDGGGVAGEAGGGEGVYLEDSGAHRKFVQEGVSWEKLTISGAVCGNERRQLRR